MRAIWIMFVIGFLAPMQLRAQPAEVAPPVAVRVVTLDIEGLEAELERVTRGHLEEQLSLMAAQLVGELPGPREDQRDEAWRIRHAVDAKDADGLIAIQVLQLGPVVRFWVRSFDSQGIVLHESSTTFGLKGFPAEADLAVDLSRAVTAVATARKTRQAADTTVAAVPEDPPRPVDPPLAGNEGMPPVKPGDRTLAGRGDQVKPEPSTALVVPEPAGKKPEPLDWRLWGGAAAAGLGVVLAVAAIAPFGTAGEIVAEADAQYLDADGNTSDSEAYNAALEPASGPYAAGWVLVGTGVAGLAAGGGLLAWGLAGE